jgi:N-acylneuraminate cytidylyltransferase
VDHAIAHISSEHILLLQATSPLTTAKHLTDAIAAYAHAGCRPLVTGTRQHHFYWHNDGTPANYIPGARPRRQDWPGSFVENGAFYLFSRQDFLASGIRCKPPCTLFEMEPIHSTEIDTSADWLLLERLVKGTV